MAKRQGKDSKTKQNTVLCLLSANKLPISDLW